MTRDHTKQADPVPRQNCNEPTELTTQELAAVAGGFLAFTFKLVAVKTVSWAHDDESPKPPTSGK